MTTEVTTKQTTALATTSDMAGLLTSDVIIPSLLLMQGLSDYVSEGKAAMGDMVRSTSGEKLGDAKTPLMFVPLAPPTASFVLSQLVGKKYEYRGRVPRNATNDDLPWDYYADNEGREIAPSPAASQWKRTKMLSLYALLPADVAGEAVERAKASRGEMPDISKALTPILINFRSTSFKAGKEVVTFFTQAMNFGMKAWEYQLPLSTYLEKNDQGSYYVLSVDRTKAKAVGSDLIETVQKWAQIVSTSKNLKVDEAVE